MPAAAKQTKDRARVANRVPTPKQQKIIETHNAHPDLSTVAIGKLCETDHSHVVRTLQRYGIDRDLVDDYKTHRADVLAGLQHRLLKSITAEDVKKAPLGSRVLAAAQLYDKERLERGQSTEHVSVIVAGLRELQQARWRPQPVDN